MASDVCLWWIGSAPAPDAALVHVRRTVAHALHLEVTRYDAPARPPAEAFDEPRRQYASGVVLRWLVRDGPPAPRIVGITDGDLFVPVLTYVFGEAQLGGRAAVVSTARLGTDLGHGSGRQILDDRLAKETVHELGHTLGLLHCEDGRCVMSRSGRVTDIDRKRPLLCAGCEQAVDAYRWQGGWSR